MNTVWIVNHYSPHPKKCGKVGLHLQLARAMKELGWEVQIIAASTAHPGGAQSLPDGVSRARVRWRGTESVFVRGRSYKNDGLHRWVNMAEFGTRLFSRRTVSDLDRPDIVVGRITNPLAALAAMRWAKWFNVPFVLEISDIWPDTFVQLGAWSESGLKTRIVRRVERHLIKKSAAVMSPLPGVRKYLDEKGFYQKPFYWVPNGADTTVPFAKSNSDNRGSIKFRFMYLGSLGNANAIDTIITAFDKYVQDHEDSNAILEIVGSGSLMTTLQEQAAVLPSRAQIYFTGRIPNNEIYSKLAEADALVANMRDLPLYDYGIALNKLFEYLLSAKPIIFASGAMNNLVEEAGAGICTPPDDQKAMAGAMNSMVVADPETRAAWGESGRTFVVNNYTYAHSADRFLGMLANLTK